MRERQALSAEEMQALLGGPGSADDGSGAGSGGNPDPWQGGSGLLQEFVHFLLTGALQATDTGAPPPRRIEVGSPVWRDAGEFSPSEPWRWARLSGGLQGIIALSARAQGMPAEGGAADPQGMAFAAALLADLPVRIGRLLGVTLQAETSAPISQRGKEDGGGWVWLPARSDFGDEGLWELDLVFSATLAAGIVEMLEGGPETGAAGRQEPRSATGPWEGGPTYVAERISGGPESPRPSRKRSPVVRPFRFSPLTREVPEEPESPDLRLLRNLTLRLTVELGRSRLPLEEIMNWRPGSIVVLDRLAGEMVDVLVNGKAIAKGEVVVVEDIFSVKITDIVSPVDRVRSVPWR